MDSKEIKAALKAAREAIRNKEFKEALRQCKAILAVEKNHYNALVFVGVAAEGMDQPDQALKAYRRAAEEAPDQLLAWQGLNTMLEKHPELFGAEEKENIYKQLVSLNSSDAAKKITALLNLIDLYIKSEGKEDQALESISQLLSLGPSIEVKRNIQKQVIELLSPSAPKLSEDKMEMYKEALSDLADSTSDLSQQEIDGYIYQSLLLASQIKSDKVLERAEVLKQKFPDSFVPLEFQLRFYIDQTLVNGSPNTEAFEKIQDLTEKLKTLNSENALVTVGGGFIALQSKDFSKARDLLQNIDDQCICGLYYLTQAFLCLHIYENCVAICEKGLKACTSAKRVLCAASSDVINRFKLARAEAEREIGTEAARTSALAILEEVVETMPYEAFLIKAYIKLDEGDIEEAKKCAQYLPSENEAVKVLQASIYMKTKNFVEAQNLLEEVTNNNPSDADGMLKLGIVLWELKEVLTVENATQRAFTTLLKAAKLDPYNYKSYLYLGYIYKDVQKDLGKARRCFQKAFDLSHGTDNDVAGTVLVDTLLDLGEESTALEILQDVTAKAAAGKAKWAWLRLGLYQSKHEDPSTAIVSLQSALRADPNDNHVWECLAEAYLQRGSLTASLKAFTKAAELDPESLYCPYQIANIKHILGSLSEAIQDYKLIMVKSQNYVPVLKGLGDSLVQLAKHNVNTSLDGLAQDCCEEAIVYLTRAASQRPDLSCLWKTLGEACTLIYPLAANAYRVQGKLMGKTATDEAETVTVSKLQLFELGARCFHQALKIVPDSAALWHDLGVNLYHQSQLVARHDLDKAKVILQKASQAIKKALTLAPTDWRHWNVLGVIACSHVDEKLSLAQHCFIKSIQCESSNVVAWTNLGTLYLSRSEIQLAHDAFKAAQSVDPTYIACWIGQALIAEIVGHEEAMDLFRHTTELGVHLEGAIGYGQWVLATLGDASKQNSELFHYCIQQMAALPAATDALVKYTRRVESDPVAYNMLGLLYEHQKLYKSSLEAFKKANSLLENKKDESHLNDVCLNIARVLSKLGQHEEAAAIFGSCDFRGQIQTLCTYGLALYKSNCLPEAFKVYQTALEEARTDSEKSEVYAALGMLSYAYSDSDGAMSQLFSSFQTGQPSPQGLLALCALGLLQKNLTLVSAALDELDKLTSEDCLKDVALMHLYRFILEDDLPGGEAYLRDVIKAHPENKDLFSLLTTFIMSASNSVEAVVRLSEDLGQVISSGHDSMLETLVHLSLGAHSRLDGRRNALKSAQKAFRTKPGCLSTLVTLAGAVHAEGVIRLVFQRSKQLLSVEADLLGMILARDNVNKEVKKWTLQSLVVNNILCKDWTKAQKFLDQLAQREDSQTFVESVQNFLANKVSSDGLQGISYLALLMSCAVLVDQEKHKDAVDILHNYRESSELSSERHKSIMERTAYITTQRSSDDAQSELEKIGTDLKEKDIGSCIVSLLQAKSKTAQDNPRLCKHLFATALDQSEGPSQLGYGGSMARQGLVSLLWGSKKESDQKLLQALLEDAKVKDDRAMLQLTEQLAAKA